MDINKFLSDEKIFSIEVDKETKYVSFNVLMEGLFEDIETLEAEIVNLINFVKESTKAKENNKKVFVKKKINDSELTNNQETSSNKVNKENLIEEVLDESLNNPNVKDNKKFSGELVPMVVNGVEYMIPVELRSYKEKKIEKSPVNPELSKVFGAGKMSVLN